MSYILLKYLFEIKKGFSEFKPIVRTQQLLLFDFEVREKFNESLKLRFLGNIYSLCIQILTQYVYINTTLPNTYFITFNNNNAFLYII